MAILPDFFRNKKATDLFLNGWQNDLFYDEKCTLTDGKFTVLAKFLRN